MKARSLIVVLLLALITLFAAVNWVAFTTPTTLSLVVATVEAPLGLVMLGALAAVVLVFAIYMALWQSNVLIETRRYSKELQAQRTLADQAEASRFTELRAYLQGELTRLETRIASAEEGLRNDLREHGNSLAAYLGEIDDRVQRRDVGTRVAPVAGSERLLP